MKIRLQVEIIGDNSVAWCKHSAVIEGEEAQRIINGLEDWDPDAALAFPKPNGEVVWLTPEILKRAIVTVEYL